MSHPSLCLANPIITLLTHTPRPSLPWWWFWAVSSAGSLLVWLAVDAEGEDDTHGGAISAVQLPPNVFQNYGEVEEDDPYRYYQPNYPAPRPVSPDETAFDMEDGDLTSPGVYRSKRSLEGAEQRAGLRTRRKRGVTN